MLFERRFAAEHRFMGNNMDDDLSFTLEGATELARAEVEAINGQLRSYNAQVNPDLWVILAEPANQPRPLQVAVRSTTSEILGGLLATTSMSWLKIEIMAVREDQRRRGIGAQLLGKAEGEARRRGCRYSFLDTMEYQAPAFYQKCGYQIVGTIPDWDSHNHAKYFFSKRL